MMTDLKGKWEAELTLIKMEIQSTIVELKKARDYTDNTYGESYNQRSIAARKLGADFKRLETKRKYRERKLTELTEGPPKHHDIFGQEFKVGCQVAWSSAARYAGAQIGTVTGVTAQMVRVSQLHKWRPESGTSIYPKNLIIVDKLIEGYSP